MTQRPVVLISFPATAVARAAITQVERTRMMICLMYDIVLKSIWINYYDEAGGNIFNCMATHDSGPMFLR
jgi:hypothetical protein